jgi:aminoglycoside phosphotransferase (APT) family kinase protein
MFPDIASGADWKSAEPVNKGWSSDRKYRIQTYSGAERLLRVSDIEQYADKKKEFGIIQKYARLGFEMSAPLEFGTCGGGKNVYMLLSWVKGQDMETALPGLPEKEQYLLGRQAGGILRKIHSVPLDPEDVPRQTKKEKKLLQLSRYEDSDLRIPGDETALKFVKANIDLIWHQPPVYMHGDYHPGNLIYTESGGVGVIDFNRWEVGDPYEEFYKLESFGADVSVPYCIGQIDAYFSDRVPQDFWTANAVYAAQASLFSIKWAERFGRAEIDGMVARANRAFDDFDGFKLSVPRWYTDKYRKAYAEQGRADTGKAGSV